MSVSKFPCRKSWCDSFKTELLLDLMGPSKVLDEPKIL